MNRAKIQEENQEKQVFLNFVNRGLFNQADDDLIFDLQLYFRQMSYHVKFTNYGSFNFLNFFMRHMAKPVAVFTNFPPDNTYNNSYSVNISSDILYAEADAYEISKKHLSDLANAFPDVPFYVITGAPVEVISDLEICSLSNNNNIWVKRKREFLSDSSDYSEALKAYYIKLVKTILDNHQ